MADESLEHALLNLPKIGQLVKDRGYRQIWRFEIENKAYYLKFYPRDGFFWKRLIRGNPAMREFTRLQALQKAKVPSPRVRSVLVGFKINGLIGDAVIIDAIEPSIQLDHHLNQLELQGVPLANHRVLAERMIDLLSHLAAARLGHTDLHLGNFLLQNDRLYLLDGYAVRPGGMKTSDLALLAYSIDRHATRTDLLRGWNALSQHAPFPRRNLSASRQIDKFLSRVDGENRYFGRVNVGAWQGHFFKQAKFAQRWSKISARRFTPEMISSIWTDVLEQVESDKLKIHKRSRSGDVLESTISVDGKSIGVMIKRPRRKYWRRAIVDFFRDARARRTWHKAWGLFIRGIPMEWPLLLMERRVLGYPKESVILFEKMEGPLLSELDLSSLEPAAREVLFRRLGRTLRKIEREGMSHFDAKATNWVIRLDEKTGPTPILIDVDGVRYSRWTGEGIDRLLRSMREHPQYTPEDSRALCQGYAPYAKFARDIIARTESEATPEAGEAP